MQPATTADIKPGTRLGRYEIVEKLAVGGMAEIYLGRVDGTAGFTKLVAIKRILPAVAGDRGFVKMFLDEARLAATLQHTNIADVFDVGEHDGSYFFAMEFVHGQDARSIKSAAKASGRKIPLEISLAIASATTFALAYAHAKTDRRGRPLHLVHRDISPSNILVSYDGAVKLVDFGIARAEAGSRLAQTQTGALRGKIPYMSPEQCRGQVVDQRCDLFSLGVVLYELTTGERPFDGISEFDTLERIVYGRCRRPSEVDATYPVALEAIVMRLLATKPRDRYQTAAELLTELERFVVDAWLVASEHAVSTYMRDLFAEEILEWENRSLAGGYVEDDTAAYPAELPEPVAKELARAEEADLVEVYDEEVGDDDEATVAVKSSYVRKFVQTDVDPLPVVRPRTGVRAQIDLVESTVAEIEASLVSTEPLDRVSELLDRAAGWSKIDVPTKAVIAVELALAEEPRSVEIDEVLLEHFASIKDIFERFIGDRKRMPVLAGHLDELELRIDQRAAFLLSRIDGTLSVAEVLAVSAMPRMQAYRHLCHLMLRGIVVLV